AVLNVSGISLPNGFSLGTSLPLAVNPGNSATFTVSIDTSTVMGYSGQMTITDNDTVSSPFAVTLSGSIVAAPEPSMGLADGSTTIANGGDASFGKVVTGSSASKSFSVNNSGTSSLTVSAVSLPGGFSLGTTLPLTIAAGGSA